MKRNPWVWTALTESIKPDRKEGTPVPTEYMTEGTDMYYPNGTWIKKGYVRRVDKG